MNEKQIIQSENTELEKLLSEQETYTAPAIDIPKLTAFKMTDFSLIIEECSAQALKIVQNTALFYVTLEEIKSDLHLTDKIDMDTMELSNLLFQSKSAQSSYVKLLEEIDTGNVHPRIFEVQSALQKSMMEITKSKTTYIQIMETSWKNVKTDLQMMGKSVVQESEEIEGGFKTRGTKDLLKNIQDNLKEDNKTSGETTRLF